MKQHKRILAALAALLTTFLFFGVNAQETVTDSQGVIYDIVSQPNHTVRVSAKNNSNAGALPENIVIPLEVMNTNTTTTDRGPYTVVAMANAAFRGVAKIKTVEILPELAEIPSQAFQNCSGMVSIQFPASVTKIQSQAFAGCSSLTDISDISNLVEINSWGFNGCSSLETINLPPSLAKLDNLSFQNCTSLKEVEISEKVVYIGDQAFQGCTSLQKATLHEGLDRIHPRAFDGCTILEAPTLPSTLTSIGSYAFQNCKNLGDVTFPDKVSIKSNAFLSAGITSITWPETALTIEYSAFSNVSGLTKVTIPGWFTSITSSLFLACPDLKEVVIEEGVKTIEGSTFSQCSSLSTITFPESLDVIKSMAFYKCVALTGVKFPERMTSIEGSAFKECSTLGDITLPAGANLGEEAFVLAGLTSITWPKEPMGTISARPFGQYQHNVKELKIPGWMEVTPFRLCYGWDGLEKLEIEEGVKEIYNYSFNQAMALKTVIFPSSLRKIDDHAFYQCTALEDFVLPEGLEEIAEQAFANCNSLKNLTLPSTLTTVGDRVFYDCNGLENLICTNGLKFIGKNMFYSCDNLQSVDLGDTMESLDENAFSMCSKLVCPVFPASLKSIGVKTFYRCSSQFGTVALHAGMQIGTSAFDNTGVNDIVFPDEPCEFGGWVFSTNSNMDHIDFPEWMISVPDGFCKNWSKLRHVGFGDQVESIGEESFMECKYLHNVDLPESLNKIGAKAFKSCGILADCNITHEHTVDPNAKFGPVDLYDGVEIGDEAFMSTPISELIFHGCADFQKDCFSKVSTIKKIQFPECMSEIPAGFCKEWQALEYVILPASLTQIHNGAFYNDSKIKSIFVADDPEFTSYKEKHDLWATTPTEERGEEPQLPDGVFNFFSQNLDSIGVSAFYYVPIPRIDWPDRHIDLGTAAFQRTSLSKLEIPAWMDKIPEKCFSYCFNLHELTWADRADSPLMLEVGNYAFQNDGLTTINMPPFPSKWGDYCFKDNDKATSLNFTEAPLEIGKGMWQTCTKLEGFVWPSTMTVIPQETFQSCTSLTKADLSSGVTHLQSNSFSNTGPVEVIFANKINQIDYRAFFQSRLTEIHIPAGVSISDHEIFAQCKSLRTITIGDGPTQIPASMFDQCISLEEFKFPSTVETVQIKAFQGCTSLKKVEFNEGLKYIYENAFNTCSSLPEVEFPSTVEYITNYAFNGCSSLERVISHAEGIKFYSNVFSGNANLKQFIADGSIKSFDTNVFANCVNLEDFIYTGKEGITSFNNSVFQNCTSLKAFPYMGNATISSYIFENCTSLTQLVVTENEKFYTGGFSNDFFKGCSSLQSLIFPYTGKYFRLAARDVAGCPLEGLSFAYSTNCEMPYDANSTITPSIIKYDPENPSKLKIPTPQTSKLIVMRGEKWKFEEQGYGELFEIEELKDPQINIDGFIHSEFHPESNTNHYRACLRWEIPYSDLNENGQTEVIIKRDGKEIGSVIFEKPYITTDKSLLPEGIDFNRAIIVDYTVKGMKNDFRGDFYFPETAADGSVKYQYQYANEDNRLIFNADTHKRYATFTKYGYHSWFTMFDEFDSDNLSNSNIQTEYTYSAVLKKYPFGIPVNNENFEIINDKRYHYEPAPEVDRESNKVVMRVAMAVPQLSTQGLYTWDEIVGDTPLELKSSSEYFVPGKLNLAYSFDPSMVGLQYYENGSTQNKDIFTVVEAKEITDNGSTRDVGTVDLTRNGHASTGIVSFNAGEELQTGHRYQTVVNSGPLGSFGSPVLTIPGTPTINPTAHLMDITNHSSNDIPGHDNIGYHARIQVNPDCSRVGYDALDENVEYYYGLRRGVGAAPLQEKGWYNLSARAEASSELIHHIGEFESSDPACGECHNEASGLSTHDEYGLVYNDVAFLPKGATAQVNYQMTLYVKVPEDKLRTSQPMYMVATATASDSKLTPSGVENVEVDPSCFDPSEVRYFDLQGRPVTDPLPGQTYLEVTPAGTRKITPATPR